MLLPFSIKSLSGTLASSKTARLNRKYKGAPPDDAKAALNQGLLEYLDDLVVRARLPTRDQLKTMHNQAGVLAKQIERQTALAEEAKAKAVQAQQSIPAAVAEVQRLETDAPHAEAKGRSDYWVGRVNASLGAARRRLANLRAEVDRLTAEADAAERKAAEARDQLAQKRAAIADADRRVREHKEQQQKRGGESGAEAGDATPAPVAERNKGGGQRRPRRRKGDNADGTSKFTADFSLSSALSLLAHRRDSLLASLGQAQQSMRDVAAYFPKAVQQQAKSAVTSPRQPIPLVPPVKAGVAGFVPH